MDASANTSTSQNLLTARNAIIVAVSVLALSLLWACATMLRPNDSDGLARDSYGTHGDGYRALLEIMQELQVPVERSFAPPQASENRAETIVLLGPDPQLVLFEPKYLKSLLSWIDEGGRLIVAPAHVSLEFEDQFDESVVPGERDLLKLLEVNDAVTLEEQPASAAVVAERKSRSNRADRHNRWEDDEFVLDKVWESMTQRPAAPRTLPVEATGSLAALASGVRSVAAPGDEFGVLVEGAKTPVGALRFKNEEGNDMLLAAVVPRGQGEIIVVSDPALANNALIARADNSVLMAGLLAPAGHPVVFDEYYHGLAVRGNPLFLLTRPGFAAVAAAILLGIGILAWRSATFLGPPLTDTERPRRDIQEYIHAMGAYFSRGPGHRRFLVSEMRGGVLHELCGQLGLPPHTTDVDTIAAVLERRSPSRAGKLRSALREIDQQLAAGGNYPRALFLPSVQRLAGCL
jgi:hypothetical protein